MAIRMQQRRGTAGQWTSANPILNAGEIGYESDTNKFKIGDGVNHWADLDYFIDENALGTTLGDYVETSLLAVANGVATLNSSGVLETSQLPALAISDTTVVADQTARLALTAQVGDVAIQTDNGTTYILAASPASTNSNWKEITATAATDAAITAERSATATLTNKTLTSPKLNEDVAITATATELNILDGATLSTTELNYLDGVTSSVQDQLNSKLESANLAEAAQDAVNAALIAGTGLDKTYDDNANTITLDIDSTVATKTYADDAVSTHNSDTTSVHGISDTAELATKTFAAELLTNATKTNIVITGDKNGLTITAENGVADSTTDNLTEGTTNKYFTDERAQDAVGNAVGTGLSYNDSTGAISVTANTYDAYGSASTVAGNLSTHESDSTTHGVTGNIVGTSDTQTLTNKTLTSPKINEDVVLTATATELNYVDGVTSAIQTQLNNLDTDKADLASPTFTGTLTANDVVVNGDFTVNGTNFSASATTIVIEDNLVQLAHGNTANTVDLGIVVGYTESSTAKHSGIVRDVSADKWKLFKGVTTEPTTTVDFTQGSLDDLEVAGFTASSITVGDVSNTEFGYLNGVTSGIQSQLDDKAPLASPTFTGTVSGITSTMVGLGNVENTALSTWAGSSNITTLGTVTTGTWNGTTIAIANGGTGATDAGTARTNLGLAIGTDVQAYNSTLAAVAGGTYTGDDSIATVGTITAGTWNGTTIAIANGGTGATTAATAAANLLPDQSSNSGKYLTTDGAGTLSWATVSGYSAPTLGSTSIASGSTVTTIAGLTLSGATLTGSLTAGGSTGTNGFVLTSTGSGVQWAAASGGANEVMVLMGAL